jgi:hypothetical protein
MPDRASELHQQPAAASDRPDVASRTGGAVEPGAVPASLAALLQRGGERAERTVVSMQERVGNHATSAWLQHHGRAPAPGGRDDDDTTRGSRGATA